MTLDGSGSYDSDEDYPLSFFWQIVSKPEGSAAALDDPTSINPTFTADMLGNYNIELVVTDSLDVSSIADGVTVSTLNIAPIADAGDDQAVIEIGTLIQLDGCRSWDDDGDPLNYTWSFISLPAGSQAVLSDPTICDPEFIADINGDYLIRLVVNDLWTASEPDNVTVSFNNLTPVALAGNNQSVVQGDTVYIDGSGSYDANLDPLIYRWSIVYKPIDSLAQIDSPTLAQTYFIADLPGEYIISLIVNDGFVDSDPNNITVVAISYQDAVTDNLQNAAEIINNLDDDVLKNPKNKNALTNKINAALTKVEEDLYQEALDKIENDIIGKTDGCAETGSPDNNDWIRDCASQNQVYPLLLDAILQLSNLI